MSASSHFITLDAITLKLGGEMDFWTKSHAPKKFQVKNLVLRVFAELRIAVVRMMDLHWRKTGFNF